MLIGIHTVDVVAEEGKRRTCLDGRFEDQADEIFEQYFRFRNAHIVDAIVVALLPFVAVAIL